MDSKRLFLAVRLSPETQHRIGALTGALREQARIAWVPEANFHVTLKFLGNVPTDRIPRLVEAVTLLAGERRSFSLSARGVGAFPGEDRASVLWVGVSDDGSDVLAPFVESLESALDRAGFAREWRPFHPHLTIARARPPMDVRPLLLPHHGAEFGQSRVHELILFDSSADLEYQPIATFQLQP